MIRSTDALLCAQSVQQHGKGNAQLPRPFASMLEFLGNLLWPVAIVVTTVSIVVVVGVFIATRKLD